MGLQIFLYQGLAGLETREGLGEFSTVMQTRDEVEGLHNCLEFSQPLSCLYQAKTPEEGVFPYISYYNQAAHPHQEFLGVPPGLKRVQHTNKHKKILKVNLKGKI